MVSLVEPLERFEPAAVVEWLARGIVFLRRGLSQSKSDLYALKECLLCYLSLLKQDVVVVRLAMYPTGWPRRRLREPVGDAEFHGLTAGHVRKVLGNPLRLIHPKML